MERQEQQRQEQQRQPPNATWRSAAPDRQGVWEGRFRRGALSLKSGSVSVSLDAYGHLVYCGLGMGAGLLADLPIDGREWRESP